MKKMTQTDSKTAETIIIESGYHQLSGEELKQRIGGKTIRGDYLYGFKFVTFFDRNGSMEGKNNVGAHHFGEWSVDMKDKSFTVKWDNGWDNTTSRAYDVAGEIQFYDCTTGQWRTTFKEFEEGETALNI
jgi:hypothetical protein